MMRVVEGIHNSVEFEKKLAEQLLSDGNNVRRDVILSRTMNSSTLMEKLLQ